jgi:hypothetical protein
MDKDAADDAPVTCNRTCDNRLYNRPSTGEVDLVDTELLLAIAVTNAGVDVVVV